jgi:hypothetical protein
VFTGSSQLATGQPCQLPSPHRLPRNAEFQMVHSGYESFLCPICSRDENCGWNDAQPPRLPDSRYGRQEIADENDGNPCCHPAPAPSSAMELSFSRNGVAALAARERAGVSQVVPAVWASAAASRAIAEQAPADEHRPREVESDQKAPKPRIAGHNQILADALEPDRSPSAPNLSILKEVAKGNF